MMLTKDSTSCRSPGPSAGRPDTALGARAWSGSCRRDVEDRDALGERAGALRGAHVGDGGVGQGTRQSVMPPSCSEDLLDGALLAGVPLRRRSSRMTRRRPGRRRRSGGRDRGWRVVVTSASLRKICRSGQERTREPVTPRMALPTTGNALLLVGGELRVGEWIARAVGERAGSPRREASMPYVLPPRSTATSSRADEGVDDGRADPVEDHRRRHTTRHLTCHPRARRDDPTLDSPVRSMSTGMPRPLSRTSMDPSPLRMNNTQLSRSRRPRPLT